MRNWQSIFKKFIISGVYLIFLLPLVPDFFIANLYLKREIIFSVIIEILAVFYFIYPHTFSQSIVNGKKDLKIISISDAKSQSIRKGVGVYIFSNGAWRDIFNFKNKLFLVLSIFTGAFLLSTIFSLDNYRSFWGTFFRFGGFFTWLHLFVFFLILAAFFKSKGSWLKLFNYILGINFFICLIFIFQKLTLLNNIKFLQFTALAQADLFRPGSTLDNPIFLATYLIFGSFISLYLLAADFSFKKKILYGGLFILQSLVLILTLSRGAFLGWLIGVLIYFIYELVKFIKNRKENVSKKLIYFLAVGLIILIVLPFLFSDKMSLSRLADFSAVSNKNRLMVWQIAVQSFFEKPFFGWGAENFYVSFNKHFNPEFFSNFSVGNESWFDRTHNNYLDILVAHGIVGFASYLAILFVVFYYYLYKNNQISQREKFIFSSLIIAYLTANFFAFDTFTSLLMFLFILAFLARSDFLVEKVYEKTDGFNKPIFIGLSFLAVIIIYYYNFLPAHAQGLRLKGEIYAAGNQIQSINFYSQAFNLNTIFNQEILLSFANLIFDSMENSSGQISNFEDLNSLIKKTDKKYFFDARLYFLYGSILNIEAENSKESGILSEAKDYLLKARELSSSRQQIYFALAQNSSLSGNYDEAVKYLETAVNLNPDSSVSHWNLGLAYFQKGDYLKSVEYVEKAVSLGYYYKNKQNLLNLVLIHYKAGDNEKTQKLLKETLELYPETKNILDSIK